MNTNILHCIPNGSMDFLFSSLPNRRISLQMSLNSNQLLKAEHERLGRRVHYEAEGEQTCTSCARIRVLELCSAFSGSPQTAGSLLSAKGSLSTRKSRRPRKNGQTYPNRHLSVISLNTSDKFGEEVYF